MEALLASWAVQILSHADDDPLVFADAQAPAGIPAAESPAGPAWKVAVIDDDPGMHAVTRLVLESMRYKDRPLQLLHARSAAEARELLRNEPDLAVVLLDVVMETESAGLDVVRFIRDELGNRLVRIVLRTGQPGKALESRVITEFDINDYREKSELSAQKLVTTVTAALRGYDDLLTIRELASSKDYLESLVRDRTARLSEVNRRLAHKQALLAEAQRLARVGNYEWSLADQQVHWSGELYAILGLDPAGQAPTMATLLELVPSEERALLEQRMEQAVRGAQGYALQHHVRRADGTLARVHHRAEVQVDAQGRAVRITGILQDISEQYRAEERMRKLSTAMEQTADSMMITDADGRIDYVNAAFSRISGYSSAEVVGRTPRVLKSGEMPAVFYRRLWGAILRGEVFSDVVINRRKDGTLYHEALTITPQRDERGAITHFISTGRDITDQIRIQERIEHLAHHDALTALPNRTLLMDRIDQAMSRAKWRQRHVAVLFMDLDRFKVINDTLGHTSGDELLRALAARLIRCVRDGDTVARLGGDEFAVVLNDVATTQDVERVARQLLDAVSVPFEIEGRELFVTTSIGISMYPQHGNDSLTLLKRADAAMYNAKLGGKNSFQFHTERDEATQLTRLGLETALRRALERDEFFLVFQPQFDADSGRMVSMEALLRWRRGDGQVVQPDEFIGLLEETGMILSVGDWVLRKACAEAQVMRASGVDLNRVAVNISLNQFRQSDFVRRVGQVLQDTGLPPQFLELEVTEGVLVDNVRDAALVLEQLNALGVRLSIDDFGTGYSSMNYLRRLPFDMIKIDKSFVDGLPGNKDNRAIVTAIITLAQSMELDVVAEGVETGEQLDCVRSLGCHLVQGYYFSPPIPPEELRALPGVRPAGGADDGRPSRPS
jgi:diguanylate cyclase (GGDEF)-like protein/PAS domain S-box-containing protein